MKPELLSIEDRKIDKEYHTAVCINAPSVNLKRDSMHIIRCERRLAGNEETLRKQRKAGKFTVLSEIRTNFESSGEFCDVSIVGIECFLNPVSEVVERG